MIKVFVVFTGKLLQTLQNSSFHKTYYLEAKTNVLHNFVMACNFNFLKFGHDKLFCCFYWKTAANTAK